MDGRQYYNRFSAVVKSTPINYWRFLINDLIAEPKISSQLAILLQLESGLGADLLLPWASLVHLDKCFV